MAVAEALAPGGLLLNAVRSLAAGFGLGLAVSCLLEGSLGGRSFLVSLLGCGGLCQAGLSFIVKERTSFAAGCECIVR